MPVFDEEVYQASRGTRFDEVVEAGKVVRSETLEDLAETFGLLAAVLVETVEETNRSIRGEVPSPFGREEFGDGPLEPPFYGIHVRGELPDEIPYAQLAAEDGEVHLPALISQEFGVSAS